MKYHDWLWTTEAIFTCYSSATDEIYTIPLQNAEFAVFWPPVDNDIYIYVPVIVNKDNTETGLCPLSAAYVVYDRQIACNNVTRAASSHRSEIISRTMLPAVRLSVCLSVAHGTSTDKAASHVTADSWSRVVFGRL